MHELTGLYVHVREKNNPFEEWDCSLSEIAIFILFTHKNCFTSRETNIQIKNSLPKHFAFIQISLEIRSHSICVLCFLLVSLVETASSDWRDIYSFEIPGTYVYFRHAMLFHFYCANSKTVNTLIWFWHFPLCSNQSEATWNHKLITVTICGLVFSRMIGFLLETQ